MNFATAMEKAKNEYKNEVLDYVRATALKYIPAVVVGLAVMTFFLNFAVLRFAIPSEPVEFRSRALVEELDKRSAVLKQESEHLREENKAFQKQIEELKSRLDKMNKGE